MGRRGKGRIELISSEKPKSSIPDPVMSLLKSANMRFLCDID
jgi:hypothetical protein